jgi:glycosyl transferase, family 25
MNASLQEFYKQLNLFFDKVYVITLRRATERHEHVKQTLEGLEYELFYGVDKQDLDLEELKHKGIYDEVQAINNHRFTKPLLPGMIGCSWSHRKIYEDIIAHNFRNALILEDDLLVDESTIALFPEMIKELPKNWELIYLGYARNEEENSFSAGKKLAYHIQRFFGRFKLTHRTIRNLYPRKITDHVYHSGYHDQTHAYGITLAGAKKLKELQEPISFIADNLLAHAATNEIIKAYVFKPKLINQLSQGEEKKTGTYVND